MAQELANHIARIQSGEVFVLSEAEMALLLPFLREAAAAKGRHADNLELCQLLARIFRLGARLYGAPPATREHCICEG
ncbi:hypothetical protein AB0F88_17060 [Streptosporangium sp. NPDC023963]|uniref:hypothetical protein n=1 Tax=Streptosporangium sp. NPDC023963 TaxID=3155608 RepID=UPI0034405B06